MRHGLLACALLLLPLAAVAQEGGSMTMMPIGGISFTPLDPAQPDGIQVAIISGDPTAGAFRGLGRFPAAFDSGQHSHTYGYLSVLISGSWQHGASAAAAVDLPAGSYWMQPGGEGHMDRCTASEPCLTFMSFDGPLDFLAAAPGTVEPGTGEPSTAEPSAVEGAGTGEGTGTASAPAAPTNSVPASAIAWAPLDPTNPQGMQVAVARGDLATGPASFFLMIPPGGDSGLHGHTGGYTAVVVSGTHSHGPDAEHLTELPAGSWWTQPGGEMHVDRCVSTEPCILFGEIEGAWDFIPPAQ